MKAVCLATLSALLLLGLDVPGASANDGRDRYQVGYPNLFVHLDRPVGPKAGFQTLSKDMPGGADGDPAYRWAQSHALAVLEVAAYRTAKALGPGPHDMAVFDLSSENGDTPVGFPRAVGEELPAQPRGRHPGGSHDGGVNLDFGYYLLDLEGKVESPDFAACTEHYREPAKGGGPPKEANMCTGPADRLDVDRQAFFFLQLVELHRGRFGGRLLDEVGVDHAVFAAVVGRLKLWVKEGKHGATAEALRELEAICTSDRWGGWQRFHHHHTHVRLQAMSPTGPLRHEIAAIEREARSQRATLAGHAMPDAAVALDARLLSYRMGRAVEVRVPRIPGRTGKLTRVRYRLDGGPWQPPDDGAEEDFRYVFDLKAGVAPGGTRALVEAELRIGAAQPVILKAEVPLPAQDPRLHIRHDPGQITGAAAVKGSKITLRLEYPPVLRHLLTGVRYNVYPQGGGGPEVYVVEAGWFAKKKAGATRVAKHGLPMVVKMRQAPAYIEAEAFLAGRYRVPVAVHIGP